METVTKAAHNAVASLFPFTVTIGGQTLNAVQLDPWETESDMMPGYRNGDQTTRVAILKADFAGKPNESMQVIADGKKGRVAGVSESVANWTLTIICNK